METAQNISTETKRSGVSNLEETPIHFHSFPVGVHHPFWWVGPMMFPRVLFGLFGFDFFCNFYLLWCLWCFCCFGHKVSKLRFQALHNLAGIHILPRCMWSVKQGDSNWKSNHKLNGNLIATSPREANYLKGSWKTLPSTKCVKPTGMV